MTNRVVVTGIGVITSVGIGKDDFWKGIDSGKSGVSKIELFDTSEFKIKHAYEVKGINLHQFLDEEQLEKMGRTSHFGIASTKMAIEDSGIELKKLMNKRLGVCVGSGLGEMQEYEGLCDFLNSKGKALFNNLDYNKYMYNTVGENIASSIGFVDENFVFGSGCAASSYAIAYSFDKIRNGDADIMIAGGSDLISKTSIAYFSRVASSPPVKCQPFDKNRKVAMLGDGAGIIILESLQSALSRNAEIYGEILSYALSCEAFHFTKMRVDGISIVMKKALNNAELLPEDVQYICTHGTGTPLNDRIETEAIKIVFGKSAWNVPASSIKSMIGHTSGASGVLGVIASLLVCNEKRVPPTINYEKRDPDCDLDYVPNASRDHDVNVALINAFGFGGNNCSILVKKFEND